MGDEGPTQCSQCPTRFHPEDRARERCYGPPNIASRRRTIAPKVRILEFQERSQPHLVVYFASGDCPPLECTGAMTKKGHRLKSSRSAIQETWENPRNAEFTLLLWQVTPDKHIGRFG